VGDVTYYDAEADQWAAAATKPTPVTDIQAALLGGRIYVPGGETSKGSISAELAIYDPRDDTWSLGAALPEPRSAYGLVAFEGNLYLFGGWDLYSNMIRTRITGRFARTYPIQLAIQAP